MSEYEKAKWHVVNTKLAMDDAQVALEKAEDEWHQACMVLDEMEDGPLPERQSK
jgi:hypothetical protein